MSVSEPFSFVLPESVQGVPCPFKWVSTYRLIDATNVEHLREAGLKLRQFCETYETTPCSFLIRVQGDLTPTSYRGLGNAIRTVIETAAREDETYLIDILDSRWRLVIAGVPLFAIAISSYYPANHPRYCSQGSYLLFQPEALFSDAGITTSDMRDHYTARAKRSFERHGRRYFEHHTAGTPKALRFVLDENGDGIVWWNDNSSAG